jgi:hypothetical protein
VLTARELKLPGSFSHYNGEKLIKLIRRHTMNDSALPLALELATPVLLAGDLAEPGHYDAKLQTCGSNTRSTQRCKSINYQSGIAVDVIVDIQIDDIA